MLHLLLHPPRPPRTARVERGIVGRGVRDVGGVRGAEPCRHASRRNKGGGSRHLHKWREAWRRGSFAGRGRGTFSEASAPHDHGVGGGRLIRRLGPARQPHGFHAPRVADGGGRKPGRRGSGQRVGPSRLAFLRADWLSGAAEPPPCFFIKSKRGRRKSALLHLSFSSASDPLPPFAME